MAKELGAIRNILEAMEQKQDTHMAAIAAYHRDIAAVLQNQQILITAKMPHVLAQMNVAAGTASTSSAPDVSVPPSPATTPKPTSQQTPHTSEEENLDGASFQRKSLQKHSSVSNAQFLLSPVLTNMPGNICYHCLHLDFALFTFDICGLPMWPMLPSDTVVILLNYNFQILNMSHYHVPHKDSVGQPLALNILWGCLHVNCPCGTK